MNGLSRALCAAGLVMSVALAGVAYAQQPKPPSAAAIATAKEILAIKRAQAMYENAVPGLVQQSKNALLQSNLNYQKDLNEVATKIAKDLAGREKEIGEQMAKQYATDFTEQELKDLLAFLKSPIGKKMLEQEPRTIDASISFMNRWAQTFAEEINGKFRAEMKARGKDI
ncbi:MAG: DUF2059 domain-containing protein [Pseudomonadota bacterium]|jgi:hypothetical protein